MTNYLNPEGSPFDTLPDIARYYRVVASRLLPEHSTHTVAVAVRLPSFECEWALRLHGTHRRGYSITVSESENPLYGVENESVEVSISQHSIDVSHDFADLLTNAWAKALLTVANVNRPPIGVDGVSYHFVTRHPQHGRLSGQTWSPRPLTIAGSIVDLTERLADHVRSEDATSAMESLGEELRSFDAVPKYYCENSHLAAVQKATKSLVNHNREGFTTFEELLTQLNSAWEDLGLPKPVDLIQLVDEIPNDIRDRIRSLEKAEQ